MNRLLAVAMSLTGLVGTTAVSAQATAAQATPAQATPAQVASAEVAAVRSNPTYTFTKQVGVRQLLGNHNVLTNCDDCLATVTPSFPLTIYGAKYTSITVSSNGNIQLGPGSKATNGELPIPTAAVPGPILAPYWSDITLNDEGEGVFTRTYGTSPNRQFVIEWRGTIIHNPDITVDYSIVFAEDSGVIKYIYGSGMNRAADASAAGIGAQYRGTDPAVFTLIAQDSTRKGIVDPGVQYTLKPARTSN